MTENRVLPRLFAVPGPVFEAKYPSKCGRCGRRFPVGERIRYIAKKVVAHEACAVPYGPVNPLNDPVLGTEEWATRYVPGRKPTAAPSEPSYQVVVIGDGIVDLPAPSCP